MSNRAVILANLGSPDKPDIPSVRRYLNQFLMDPYVIQLPWILRRLIVSLFVLPKRPKSSAYAYQSVWTDQGSPLLVLSEQLLKSVQDECDIPVKLAMRYGEPSIKSQLIELNESSIEEVFFIPLYPHYAESTVTTSIEEARKVIKQCKLNINLKTPPVFYERADYIQALVSSSQPWLEKNNFDHLLFSYHGLPELHITKADPTNSHCLKSEDCCKVSSPAHATCYRHQVLRTTELFVEASGLRDDQFSVSFQSRLGRAKWLEPSTEQTLVSLAEKGIKNLLVLCPAFVTDCLETLEEIEIQGTEIFNNAGGQTLTLIPCMNDHSVWVKVLASWCKEVQEE